MQQHENRFIQLANNHTPVKIRIPVNEQDRNRNLTPNMQDRNGNSTPIMQDRNLNSTPNIQDRKRNSTPNTRSRSVSGHNEIQQNFISNQINENYDEQHIQKINKQQQAVQSFENQFNDYQNKILLLINENDNLIQCNKFLMEQIKDLKNTKEEVGRQLDEHIRHAQSDLQQKIQTLIEENQFLSRNNEIINAQQIQLKDNVKTLLEENQNLIDFIENNQSKFKKEILEKENDEKLGQIINLRQQNQILETQQENLKNDFCKLQNHSFQLEQQLKSKEQKILENQEKMSENSDKKFEQIVNQNKIYKEELKQLQISLNSITQDNQNLHQSLEQIILEQEQLNKDNLQLKYTNNDLQNQLEKQQKIFDEDTIYIEKSKIDLQKLQAKINELTYEVTMKKEDIKIKQQDFKCQTNIELPDTKNIQQLKSQNQDYANALKEVQKLVQNQLIEIENMRVSYKTQIDNLEEELESQSLQNKKLQSTIAQKEATYKNKIDNFEVELESLSSQNKKLQSTIAEEKKNKIYQVKNQEDIQLKNEEIQNLQQQCDDLKYKIRGLEENYLQEIDQLKSKFLQTNNEKDNQHKLQKQISQQKTQIADLQVNLNNLQCKLDEHKKEKNRMQIEFDRILDEKKNNKESIKILESENECLQAIYNDNIMKVRKVYEQRLDDQHNEHKQQTEKQKNIQFEVEKCQRDLKYANEILIKENDLLKQRFDDYTKGNKEYDQQYKQQSERDQYLKEVRGITKRYEDLVDLKKGQRGEGSRMRENNPQEISYKFQKYQYEQYDVKRYDSGITKEQVMNLKSQRQPLTPYDENYYNQKNDYKNMEIEKLEKLEQNDKLNQIILDRCKNIVEQSKKI